MLNSSGKTKIFVLILILAIVAAGGFFAYNRLYMNPNEKDDPAAATSATAEVTTPEPTIDPNAELYDALPGIVFWGDSQTVGSGGGGINYPDIVKKMINHQLIANYDPSLSYDHVVNQAICGEDSLTIAGRAGGIPFVLTKDVQLPADNTPVEIEFRSKTGAYVCPLHNKTVCISGITGLISSENASRRSKESNVYTFTRISEGEATTLKAGTEIIYPESTAYRKYIQVMLIGQNGTFEDTEELIEQLQTIINRQSNENKRYIVIGTHTGTAEMNAETEEKMQAAFGKHYINLRKYMNLKAINDSGITPCARDLKGVKTGRVPVSFKSGFVHFNGIGYALLGNLIYDRCERLGYFNKLKKKVGATERHTSDPSVALEGIDVEKTLIKSREHFGITTE